jgi:hypothetical protein
MIAQDPRHNLLKLLGHFQEALLFVSYESHKEQTGKLDPFAFGAKEASAARLIHS